MLVTGIHLNTKEIKASTYLDDFPGVVKQGRSM